ncbi:MAG: hypothetical protein JWO09_768 [Bacteroidetes bacterium]|nr:hypothetical protein [Bacteroidota bacterium]
MNELVSMAQAFSGLPMDSLIGGPLNAAAAANQGMAIAQTKFLFDTCFTSDGGKGADKVMAPIMINMVLTRGVLTPALFDSATGKSTEASISSVDTKFNLPLLTIIPLNSLAVETVDITFEMEVKSAYGESANSSSETNNKMEGGFEASFGFGPFKATVHGNVSSSSTFKSDKNTHYDKSNSAKYTVNVHAGQLPLPRGINVIIEAFAGAIQPIQMPTQQVASGGGGKNK